MQQAAGRQFETAGDAGQGGFVLGSTVGALGNFRNDHTRFGARRSGCYGVWRWTALRLLVGTHHALDPGTSSASILPAVWRTSRPLLKGRRSECPSRNQLSSHNWLGSPPLIKFLLHPALGMFFTPIAPAIAQGKQKCEPRRDPDLQTRERERGREV